jgi:hypothetical protein
MAFGQAADWSFATKIGVVRMRLPILLAVAAFVLAGCNANQTPSASTLGAIYPNYNQYNPIQYAQTSGFYGGR